MKKFVKNFIFLFICVIAISKTNIVSAKEAYYTNNNGVSLTKQEYKFLKTLYNERYVSNLTQEKYNEFVQEDLFSRELQTAVSIPEIGVYDAVHTTQAKELRLSTGCNNNNCRVVITADWSMLPGTRSYDLIGARFDAPTTVIDYFTEYSDTTTSYVSNEYKQTSYGIGCSVLLKNGRAVGLIQDFIVPTGRRIYASYQHATKRISLSNSKRYSFSLGGYGRVFMFDKIGKDTYDRMQGVFLDV